MSTLRKADQRLYYAPSDKLLPNPFIGMTSFNHFRGGKLYSDTHGDLGWLKERFPVADSVPQEGWSQGWHPDTEMAYIRIIWKDFEPEEGCFRFDFIQEILDQVRAHRQYLILRLMPHTTRPDEDVPDWLKAKIPCPERPADKRVKDSPTDPLYFERFARAIRVLGEHFDADPVFYAADIALFGAWGEGAAYETVPKEYLKLILDAYLEAYPTTILLGQICAPELVEACRKVRPDVGWRADGFGNPYHMHTYFPKLINPIMTDYWKNAPVSFEAYWYMNEWKEKGWDINELVHQAVKWHASTFNNKSSAIPYEWYPQVNWMLKHMGYRFAVRTVEMPSAAESGDQIELFLWVENRGNAPIYTKIPVTLRLKCGDTVILLENDIDITRWMPGDALENLTGQLPQDLPAGEYALEMRIGGNYPVHPLVSLASDLPMDEDFAILGTMQIAR